MKLRPNTAKDRLLLSSLKDEVLQLKTVLLRMVNGRGAAPAIDAQYSKQLKVAVQQSAEGYRGPQGDDDERWSSYETQTRGYGSRA